MQFLAMCVIHDLFQVNAHVFTVDWSSHATNFYDLATSDIRVVGHRVAVVVNASRANGISYIACLGHRYLILSYQYDNIYKHHSM